MPSNRMSCSDSFSSPNWQDLLLITGNGMVKTVKNAVPGME